jgi:hypothetical protein
MLFTPIIQTEIMLGIGVIIGLTGTVEITTLLLSLLVQLEEIHPIMLTICSLLQLYFMKLPFIMFRTLENVAGV